MDEKILERIAKHPDRATDDVRWLIYQLIQLKANYAGLRIKAEQELAQLQADYAEAVARAIKAEDEVDDLRSKIMQLQRQAALLNQFANSRAGRMPR